jgi:hypothetical protein
MLNLKINHTFLKLLSGQNVSFLLKNLLFETDFIAGSRTSAFKIVNDDVAQRTFGFPEEIASKTQTYSFVEFDAEVYFNNTLLYRGKFKLRLATKTYYEGNFIFGISDLSSQKDKTIAQILGEESYVFETNNLQTEMMKTLQIDNLPTQPNSSPVVFPVAKLANKFYNRYKSDAFFLPTIQDGDGYPLPFIKIIFILELLIQKLGYTLITPNWTANYPDMRKAIFFATKLLKTEEETETVQVLVPNPNDSNFYFAPEVRITDITVNENLRYGDYLPEMTVSELLNSIKNLFGLFLDFNSKYKTVKIFVINDLLQGTEYEDITHKVSPKHKVTPYNENTGFVFQFDKFDEDQITGYLEKPITDLSKFVYHTVVKKSDLPNANITSAENIYLVLSEHRYYYNNRSNFGASRWEEWAYPWQDYYVSKLGVNSFESDANNTNRHVKQGNEVAIQTKFAPVASNKLWHFFNKDSKLERLTFAGSITYDGKVLVKIAHNQVYTKPAWFVFRESKVYKNQYRNPVSLTATIETWLDLSFTAEEQTPHTRLCEGGFIIAESDFAASKTDKPPIRILLYHGLQLSPVRLQYNEKPTVATLGQGEGILQDPEPGGGGETPPVETGTRKYPMASSDCYDNLGKRIADFAIRWTGKYGLINIFWESIIKIKQNSRVFELQAVFTLEDLQKLEVSRKIRIRETLFFIEQMETKIGEFIDFTTLTLIRVGSESQKTFVLEPPPPPVPAAGFRYEYSQNLQPNTYGINSQNLTYNKVNNTVSIFFKNRLTFDTSYDWQDPNFIINAADSEIAIYNGSNWKYYSLAATVHPTILPNTLYHLVVTRDNGLEKVYLNNFLVGQRTENSTVGVGIRFVLGRYSDNGEVFDFKFYNRAFSDAERSDVYVSQGAFSPSGAFCDIPFTERFGTVANDISGNNNHLQLGDISINPLLVAEGPLNHHIAEDSSACE